MAPVPAHSSRVQPTRQTLGKKQCQASRFGDHRTRRRHPHGLIAGAEFTSRSCAHSAGPLWSFGWRASARSTLTRCARTPKFADGPSRPGPPRRVRPLSPPLRPAARRCLRRACGPASDRAAWATDLGCRPPHRPPWPHRTTVSRSRRRRAASLTVEPSCLAWRSISYLTWTRSRASKNSPRR